jgi:hypothetical protein
MKLSIFPECLPLPKNKAEKSKASRFASRPYLPEVVEIENDDQLLDAVCNFAWSPFVFKKARLQEDFLSTDFLVLDIDEGLTILEAENRVEEAGVTCLCVPSTSHTPKAHRFRLIFPLSKTITNLDEFQASMKNLVESFPESDPQCVTDSARYYFAHTQDDGFWLEGNLLEPTTPKVEPKYRDYDRPDTSDSIKVDLSIAEIVKELYGKEREYIPEAVDLFIKEAHTGFPGSWNINLNRCAFVLGLQNIELEAIEDLISYLAPQPLDKNDMYTIKRAWNQGNESREIE